MNTKPSDFIKIDPMNSVFHNCETEIVAKNVMIILARTGNEFRKISWDEYKIERLKDKNFTESEKSYFDNVIDYFKTADTVVLFSPFWKS